MKWCLLSGKVTDWRGTEQTPLHLLGHLWLTPFCRLGNSFKEIKWPAQGHRAVELSRQDSQPWMWCSECYTTFPSISHFHRLTISSRVFSSAETPNWVQPPFLKAQNWTWKNSSTLLLTWILFPGLQIQSQPQTAVQGFGSSLPYSSPTSCSVAALHAVELIGSFLTC